MNDYIIDGESFARRVISDYLSDFIWQALDNGYTKEFVADKARKIMWEITQNIEDYIEAE